MSRCFLHLDSWYGILWLNAHAKTGTGTRITNIHGGKILNQEVLLEDIGFPKFNPTQQIPGPIHATVFHNLEYNYNIILGMDIMQVLGIDVSCSTKTVSWNGLMIPFLPSNYFDKATIFAFAMEEDPFEEVDAAKAGYKSKTILHSKYKKVNPCKVARHQKHLSKRQQKELDNLLSKFDKLFSGKLGKYPHQKVHLELKEGAQPYTCRPFLVPKHHEVIFKDELKQLCKQGVLSPCRASE